MKAYDKDQNNNLYKRDTSERCHIKESIDIKDRGYDWDKPTSLYDVYYEIIGKIGSGGFGSVYKAYQYFKGDKRIVAVKTIPINRFYDEELLVLRNLASKCYDDIYKDGCFPYISCYYDDFIGYMDNKQYVFIVTEYIDGLSLRYYSEHLDKSGYKIRDNWILILMEEIMIGIAFIHNSGYAHRDLHGNNVMITLDESNGFQVKILDFGQSCFKNNCDMGVFQTIFEMSGPKPERKYFLPNPNYNLKYAQQEDIYSIGLVFYYYLVYSEKTFQYEDEYEYTGTPFDQILKQMLNKDVNARPNANELVNQIISLESKL